MGSEHIPEESTSAFYYGQLSTTSIQKKEMGLGSFPIIHTWRLSSKVTSTPHFLIFMVVHAKLQFKVSLRKGLHASKKVTEELL